MRQKGFTLIELMVAVIILSAGIIGVMVALGNGVDDIRRIRNMSTVANVLQEQMETVRDASFSDLDDDFHGQTGSISGVSSGSYTINVSGYDADGDSVIEVTGDDRYMRKVTITASWNQGGGTVQRNLVTLVTNSGINP